MTVDQIIKQDKLHFEGSKGLDALDTLAKECGYRNDAFGRPIENMLKDCPGLMEAMVDWIREREEDFGLEEEEDEVEEDEVEEN
jgi:hypothetical protein